MGIRRLDMFAGAAITMAACADFLGGGYVSSLDSFGGKMESREKGRERRRGTYEIE